MVRGWLESISFEAEESHHKHHEHHKHDHKHDHHKHGDHHGHKDAKHKHHHHSEHHMHPDGHEGHDGHEQHHGSHHEKHKSRKDGHHAHHGHSSCPPGWDGPKACSAFSTSSACRFLQQSLSCWVSEDSKWSNTWEMLWTLQAGCLWYPQEIFLKVLAAGRWLLHQTLVGQMQPSLQRPSRNGLSSEGIQPWRSRSHQLWMRWACWISRH